MEWSSEQIALFRTLRVDQGLTLLQCADQLGISRSAASGKARDLKLPSPRVGTGGHQFTFTACPAGKDAALFRAQWKNGVPMDQLRSRWKVGDTTIHNWVASLGMLRQRIVRNVPPRPLSPKPLPIKVVVPRAVVKKPTDASEPYVYTRPSGRCQFLTSDGKPWMVCADEAVFPRPYCAAHLRVVFGGGA